MPCASKRKAASRTAGMRARQSSKRALTTSEGQRLAPRARLPRSARIACSKASSSGPGARRRHPSLQYFTASQLRAHFFRQVIVRPQVTQRFGGSAVKKVTPAQPRAQLGRALPCLCARPATADRAGAGPRRRARQETRLLPPTYPRLSRPARSHPRPRQGEGPGTRWGRR